MFIFLHQTKWRLLRPKRAQNKHRKRHKAADCRRRRENESFKGTFEFLESIGQSEFRLVPEELEAF